MTTTLRTDLARAARRFHALSDPTRLQLILTLRRGERCVCELMDAADAGQSRVSFHLKVLKDAGLLLDRREGRWVHYRINADALAELDSMLDTLEPGETAELRCAC